MPRTRSFDPETALNAITNVFWNKGYEGATYEDLVAASGVSRKGLYNTFGDKEVLFVDALRHYRTRCVPAIFAPFRKVADGQADMRSALRKIGERMKSEGGRRGCLMANTAASDAVRGESVRHEIATHLESLVALIESALQAEGVREIDRRREVALYLTGALQGVLVLARSGGDAAIIDATIEGMSQAIG